jgi:hypothetical protein
MCQDGTCPAGTTTFRCDGPEDCPGQICCGAAFGATAGSMCVTGMMCGTGQNQLCHRGTDCPQAAPHCCVFPNTSTGACFATPIGQNCN